MRTVRNLLLARRLLGSLPERGDVVSPPLQAGRACHPETVHVQNSAPDAELSHFGDRRDAAVAHVLERDSHLRRRPALSHCETQTHAL